MAESGAYGRRRGRGREYRGKSKAAGLKPPLQGRGEELRKRERWVEG